MNLTCFNLEKLCVNLEKMRDCMDTGIHMVEDLNVIFNDSKCFEFKYTLNTDKEFFGIVVKPLSIKVEDIMNPDKDDVDIKSYSVEVDSKLFTNMNSAEIMSLVIYDIYNIVSKKAVDYFRNVLSYYVSETKKSVNYDNMKNYNMLFNMVFEETLRILDSSMDKNPVDILTTDGIIKDLNIDNFFSSAMDKLRMIKFSSFADNMESNLVLLQWYINIINDININTRYVSDVLREAIHFTGSKLIKASIVNTINELEPLTDSSMLMYMSLTESKEDKEKKKRKSLFSQIKFNGLRSLEEDVYEYAMRVKNIETENDAILLMRQLNSRLQILEDYLINEELKPEERARWEKVMEKYNRLREELTKKTVYKQKMYGLFVDYNSLQKMSDTGQLNYM